MNLEVAASKSPTFSKEVTLSVKTKKTPEVKGHRKDFLGDTYIASSYLLFKKRIIFCG